MKITLQNLKMQKFKVIQIKVQKELKIEEALVSNLDVIYLN